MYLQTANYFKLVKDMKIGLTDCKPLDFIWNFAML